MRDPERIPRILGKLHRLWKKRPDLRLGQLLVGAVYEGKDPGDPPSYDLFNVEDDETELALDRMLGESERPSRRPSR